MDDDIAIKIKAKLLDFARKFLTSIDHFSRFNLKKKLFCTSFNA